MIKPTTIGIDIAKHIFQVATLNDHQKLTSNTCFSRVKLTEFMVQQPRCIVGMEACGSSHYWSGVFTAMGHTVKLLPTAYVKGMVYGNKNDTMMRKPLLWLLSNRSRRPYLLKYRINWPCRPSCAFETDALANEQAV